MEDILKQFTAWLIALILAALQPLNVAIIVLLSVWSINILIGIATDRNDGKPFDLKKALDAARQLGLIFCILFIVSLATTGYDESELAYTIAKWATWVISYLYTTNIFRNASMLWPNNKLIGFIYSFLTTEAFGYIKDFFRMRGGIK